MAYKIALLPSIFNNIHCVVYYNNQCRILGWICKQCPLFYFIYKCTLTTIILVVPQFDNNRRDTRPDFKNLPPNACHSGYRHLWWFYGRLSSITSQLRLFLSKHNIRFKINRNSWCLEIKLTEEDRGIGTHL